MPKILPTLAGIALVATLAGCGASAEEGRFFSNMFNLNTPSGEDVHPVDGWDNDKAMGSEDKPKKKHKKAKPTEEPAPMPTCAAAPEPDLSGDRDGDGVNETRPTNPGSC